MIGINRWHQGSFKHLRLSLKTETRSSEISVPFFPFFFLRELDLKKKDKKKYMGKLQKQQQQQQKSNYLPNWPYKL